MPIFISTTLCCCIAQGGGCQMTTAATVQFCRQPRYLRPARSETGGFASPPCDGFALVMGELYGGCAAGCVACISSVLRTSVRLLSLPALCSAVALAARTAGTTVDSAELRCHSRCRPTSRQTRFDTCHYWAVLSSNGFR